jgi:hypothetical protein
MNNLFHLFAFLSPAQPDVCRLVTGALEAEGQMQFATIFIIVIIRITVMTARIFSHAPLKSYKRIPNYMPTARSRIVSLS